MKSVKNLNGIFWAKEFWIKALKCQIWLVNKKPFFWESEANFKTLQNFCPYISASSNFVMKSVKSLNRILWATEYLFKAIKCQISSTNTKPFFWHSEANVETFETFSLYIWISDNFVSKSVISLNRIFRAMKYWFTTLKCHISLTNTKPFFW